MSISIRTAFVVLLLFACVTAALAQSFNGVLTQHNDNGRTGQNLYETILTPQNVSSSTFGKLFSYSVDGQIYAQPLYVPNLSIPGKGTHNVVFVVTENDSVYAFDADGLSSTPLWQTSFINPAQGITSVLCADAGCVIYPIRGITSTPVIDPTPGANTMYLLARTANNGKYVQSLHAIDITTGAEKFGGPTNIAASVPGTGTGSKNGFVAFNPLGEFQRAGLLLLNGQVYIGWAGAQQGWIMGYNAQTLKQSAILNTVPNSHLGGVWQSGNGLAADSTGNIYAAVGDSLFDASTGGVDYGDTLLKLSGTLSVLDYFTPKDQACRKTHDKDLGSGGPLLLPTQPGSVPNEVVIAGKGGSPCDTSGFASIYLLNQDNLGKYNATQDQVVEEVNGSPVGYWSSPAYWHGPSAGNLYLAGVTKDGLKGDFLKMYKVINGQISATPISHSANTFLTGATPSISANGTSNAIVWLVERQDSLDTQPGTLPAILYAYDATNVTKMLYNSAQVVQRDQGGCGNKFQVPTIANGKVYVGTQNELDVFGLIGTPSPAPNVYLSNPCWNFPAQKAGTASTAQQITVTNSGNATLNINQIAVTGANAADFTQTNTCASPIAAAGICTITIQFAPSVAAPEYAYVTLTDNAAGSPHNIFLTGLGN